MAGVPIVVGTGTEHCRLTTSEGVGRCCDVDSPASIAAAIGELLGADPAEREALRARCRSVALERYSWEATRGGLVELYRAGSPPSAGRCPNDRRGRPGDARRRVALLLNNPFVADSRSWKIARSLAAAGWTVTVVARRADGLPEREDARRVRGRPGRPATTARAGCRRRACRRPPPASAAGGERRPGRRSSPRGRAVVSGPRSSTSSAVGLQAIRYLRLAGQWADRIGVVVPGADIWQSEGLITLPVALALRSRHGGRVVYDARDLHVESSRFARLPGPWRRLLARRERAWARSADAVITANEPYAAVLRRDARRPGDGGPQRSARALRPGGDCRRGRRGPHPGPARPAGLDPDRALPRQRRPRSWGGAAVPGDRRRPGGRPRGRRSRRLVPRPAHRRGRRPPGRRPDPLPAGRRAGRDPGLDGRGRRRSDADPADDAEPPPDDADPPVRRPRSRRPGRRVRPAGDGRDRPRDRGRRACAIRPTPARSRRPSARSSTPPRSGAGSSGRPPSGRLARPTRGTDRWRGCSRSTARCWRVDRPDREAERR